MSGHTETQPEREKRQRDRADEARKRITLTPGQAKTLRKAQQHSLPRTT
jgi:DNA-binding MarR family transcriptional regulator